MHHVRPIKHIDDSIRRSKRCEQMSEEVMIDMADSRNPKARGVQSSEQPIPEEDSEEAADRTPMVPEEEWLKMWRLKRHWWHELLGRPVQPMSKNTMQLTILIALGASIASKAEVRTIATGQ